MQRTYLNSDEIEQLEDATTNLRDQLLVRTLPILDCQISKALRIAVDDIDFARGTVTVHHQETRIKFLCPKCEATLRKSDIFCSKCGDKITKPSIRKDEYHHQQIIPIDKITLELLQEYVEQGGPVLKDGRRLIFGINRHRAWQIIKECAERARLPKFTNPETGKTHNISPKILRDATTTTMIKKSANKDRRHLPKIHRTPVRRGRKYK
ncbi:MAG: tyrosine-type recombinase/integrase [Dehalococcoidales bacterium]|nr:tyrosine-type recombinase/integrase [Dehalococcoidales bacterium]